MNSFVDNLAEVIASDTQSRPRTKRKELLAVLVLEFAESCGGEVPEWSQELVASMADGRPLQGRLAITRTEELSAFMEMLFDVRDEIAPITFDDYGEGVEWNVGELHIFICREASPYFVEVSMREG